MRNFLKSKKVIVIIVFLCFYFIFNTFKGDSTETDLWVLAKHEVENQLKSPNSAKFPSIKEAKIREFDDLYTVTAYVDADNSFGAKVRNKFTVTFKKDADGGYETDSVYIIE